MRNKFKSKLFSNIVVHQRFLPFKHRFKYSLMSFFIYYDELTSLDASISFFSYNKFNIFSFYDQDHGYRDHRSLKKFVTDILSNNSIKYNNLKFSILCFPRILGYVFNPLSVIFCFEQDELIALLYEVKNTSNEQHTYCFANKNFSIKKIYQHLCKKNFYVSPFIKMKTFYNFRLIKPGNIINVFIKQADDEGTLLTACQVGKRIELNSKNLLFQFLRHPLMSFKIILAIHFEAFRLWAKGIKYVKKKVKIKNNLSLEN